METKEFYEKVTDSVNKAAVVTADAAKYIAEIAKLNYDNARKREDIKKAYIAIGKKYVELHRADMEEEFSQYIVTIAAAEAKIAENKARINDLKKKEEDQK